MREVGGTRDMIYNSNFVKKNAYIYFIFFFLISYLSNKTFFKHTVDD